MITLRKWSVALSLAFALAGTTALSAAAQDYRDHNTSGGGHATTQRPAPSAPRNLTPSPGVSRGYAPSQTYNRGHTPNQGQAYNRTYTPNQQRGNGAGQQGQAYNRTYRPNERRGYNDNRSYNSGEGQAFNRTDRGRALNRAPNQTANANAGAGFNGGFDRDRHARGGREFLGMRGRTFADFTPAQRAEWRGGHWQHDWHDGRFGWWWSVGGAWYYYPEPVYPYPAYVADTIWIEPGADFDIEADTDADADIAPAPLPAAASGYWYYCSANGIYYPYTPTCPVPWTPVLPTPVE